MASPRDGDDDSSSAHTQNTELTQLSDEDVAPPPQKRPCIRRPWREVFSIAPIPYPHVYIAAFRDCGPLLSRVQVAAAINRRVQTFGTIFVPFAAQRTSSFLSLSCRPLPPKPAPHVIAPNKKKLQELPRKQMQPTAAQATVRHTDVPQGCVEDYWHVLARRLPYGSRECI